MLSKIILKQDNIPVVCVPPAWKPYVLHFQFRLPDVAEGGGGAGPQMNKFEQVSNDHHSMSLAEGGEVGPQSGVGGRG